MHIFFSQMVTRFRRFETAALESGSRLRRQLVVAVTANGSENGEFGTTGFDEICHKPLGMQDIYQIVIKYFWYYHVSKYVTFLAIKKVKENGLANVCPKKNRQK